MNRDETKALPEAEEEEVVRALPEAEESVVLPAARSALHDPGTDAKVRINLARYEEHKHTITEHRMITAMTTETAHAMEEIARYTHAVPAEQETLRKKEDTAQLTRVCIVVAAAIVAAAIRPEAGQWIAAIVGVLAAGEAVNRFVASRRKALPPAHEAPKDESPAAK